MYKDVHYDYVTKVTVEGEKGEAERDFDEKDTAHDVQMEAERVALSTLQPQLPVEDPAARIKQVDLGICKVKATMGLEFV